jgi:hypothetical protein
MESKKSNVNYTIENGKAYMKVSGKKQEINSVKIVRDNTNGEVSYHFIFDENIPEKNKIGDYGTYFFNNEGKFLYRLPIGSTLESTGIYLSPTEKYIGVDSGTWTTRSLVIYTFPHLTKVGAISYKGSIFWEGDTIIYTTPANENIPDIRIDDSNYHYIERLNLITKEKDTLINYDSKHDISLHDILYKTLIILVKYVDSEVDWQKDELINYKVEIKVID